MKRTLIGILCAALSVGQAAERKAHPVDDSLFSEIDGISRGLEEITGLKFKTKVPSAVLNKDQLRKFLSGRIDKTMRPADIKAESLILRMLGLIPEGFDLRGETVDLLTEQAAAFYDYQRQKLFLMQGDTGEAGIMALAHELAHALADQNYPLGKYIRQKNQSDDAASARMAVMEGQANWLMSSYLHKRAGLGPDVPEAMLQMMSGSVETSAAQFPVFAQSPLYIRESLVFPYRGGMLFQDAVYRKLGKEGFAEVFRRAPESTQQVIHPDRYLEKISPKLPAPPKVKNEPGFRKLAEGSLGEFDVRVLLEQFGRKDLIDKLAPSLVGSQFVLLEHKREKYPVFAFTTRWASPAQAKEFWRFYLGAVKAKSKTFNPAPDTATTQTGRTDVGGYSLTLAGDLVECVEGLKTSVN